MTKDLAPAKNDSKRRAMMVGGTHYFFPFILQGSVSNLSPLLGYLWAFFEKKVEKVSEMDKYSKHFIAVLEGMFWIKKNDFWVTFQRSMLKVLLQINSQLNLNFWILPSLSHTYTTLVYCYSQFNFLDLFTPNWICFIANFFGAHVKL